MFHSRTKRNKFCEKRKTLRNITLQDLDIDFEESNTIYVNESLTVWNSLSFKKVRDTCKNVSF